MKVAFVIGNGTSRNDFGLSTLIDRGTVYGCNYAAREIPMHHAIAVDRSVIFELLSEDCPPAPVFWTRKKWANSLEHEKPIYPLPEELYPVKTRWDLETHWGSGVHAAWMAAESDAEIVVLIGFDLWNNGKDNNNVYAGQHGYTRDPVDPRCWIYQLKQVFERHPDTSFVQIQPQGWKRPDDWKDIENFSLDDFYGLAEFLVII